MYDIDWSEPAIDGLAQLSLLQRTRWADVNSAIELIEYRLQRFPVAYATEISEGLWRIEVRPVGVTFTMAGQSITIESIGWIG